MVHEKVLKLYLIRHGETDFNIQGIVQGGGVDSDLNELGRAQGQAFFEYYKHISFDSVYCSSLKRTAQTLHPFVELGHELIARPELNEFNWGVLEGKKS
jgi:broad specificity phosphatase PhoE